MSLNSEHTWSAKVRPEHLMTDPLDAGDNVRRGKDEDAGRAEAGNGQHRPSLTRAMFNGLAVIHLPRLLRLASHLTDTLEDAQDLVQDTMVKACGAIHQFQSGSNMEAWLVAILCNAYRDRVRRGHRHPPWVSADAIDELDPRLGHAQIVNQSFWQNPEAVEMHADFVRHLQMAIEHLPPKLRQIVRLAAVEGHSYKEIADAVGCPIGTVMSRLSRGRDMMRAALQEDV